LNPTPCSDWVQKLSARHSDDLSPSERFALKEHLAMCKACYEVHVVYETMDAGIRSLLVCNPVPVLTQQRPQLASNVNPGSDFLWLNILSFVASMFTSFIKGISLSYIYLKLHYWFSIFSSLFSHKIDYVKSNSHNLYAIRSDSGFILWQQKSYHRHNLLYIVPVRMIGMNYVGGGTAFVSAMDFCRYTARA
jgi:Putative zinc-finger